MIKKLLSFVLLITSAGVINSYAQTTCTPDVSCIPTGTANGICPDSATRILAGVIGVAYNQQLSIMTPTNAAYWGYPQAGIDSLFVTGVDSLAPGLTFHGVPSLGYKPGNACLFITGTPTQVWNHMLVVHIIPHVVALGIHTSAPDHPNKQYRSIVTAVAGVESLDLTKFDVEQNAPNPFGDKSVIRFSSVNASDIEFKVYNLLGAIIYNNKFKSEKGVNTINIEANLFSPGVYMYSIKNGDTTITKRMVVSK